MNNGKRTLNYTLNQTKRIFLMTNQLEDYKFKEIPDVYDWSNILNDLDFDRINEKRLLKGFDSLTLYLNDVINGGFCHYCGIPAISKEELVEHIKKTNDELTPADLFLIALHEKEEKNGIIIKESDIYKKACVNKDVYSRFINMRYKPYHPSKATVICLALALELPPHQFQKFINTAGYCMQNNDNADKIIMYCVNKGFYDVLVINDRLCEICGENNALVKPPREEKVKKKKTKIKKEPLTQEQKIVAFCQKNAIDILHTPEGEMTVRNGKLVYVDEKKNIDNSKLVAKKSPRTI